jgi:phospholipid/cholesterol/gamma-HCH transport system substrate-binding protein
MHNSRTLELMVGLFVALGIAALLMLSLKVSNLSSLWGSNEYEVSAYFSNVGGLKVKSPVKLGGVKIGSITEISYDDSKYQALVKMKLNTRYTKIPQDTSAVIYTAGLLGEQYIGLEPGGDEQFLKNGSRLSLTQSAVILEQLISRVLYQFAEKSK